MGKSRLPEEIRNMSVSQRQVLAIGEIIQTLKKQANSGRDFDSVTNLKTKISGKYGLECTPRLTDIIAAVPIEHRRTLLPKLRCKPVRTASGVSNDA